MAPREELVYVIAWFAVVFRIINLKYHSKPCYHALQNVGGALQFAGMGGAGPGALFPVKRKCLE